MPATGDLRFIPTCIDRILPPHLDSEVQLLARAANPRNKVERTRLDEATGQAIGIGFEYLKCWEQGRILRVRFLDGDPALHERVAAAALEWTRYAAVGFDFGADPEAEIRITFLGDRRWSYKGMDCLQIGADQPTMSLGALFAWSDQEEIDRVVLHEFGHALGAIHEHQNPAGDAIPWDEEAVYAFYGGSPNYWTPDEVRFNVLDRYSADRVKGGEFDPDSIMLYPVPKELTVGGFEIPWTNARLSDMDKEWVGRMYPALDAAAPASSPPPVASKPPLKYVLTGWMKSLSSILKSGTFTQTVLTESSLPETSPPEGEKSAPEPEESAPDEVEAGADEPEPPPAPSPAARPPAPAIPALREERIRLDVAHPEQAVVELPFDVVVAVLQADAPPLQVDDLPGLVSVPGVVYVPGDQQLISYRVSVSATGCDVSPASQLIRLRPGQSAPAPLTFQVTPHRAGPLTIVVSAHQEDDAQQIVAAQTRVRLEVQVPAVDPTADPRTLPPSGAPGAPTTVSQGEARARSGDLAVGLALKMAYVPTALIHLLDPDRYPLVRVEVTNTAPRPRRVRVVSSVDGYSDAWSDTVELEAAGGAGATATLVQRPVFRRDELRDLNDYVQATARVQVEDLDAGRVLLDVTKRIWMLARNAAPVRIKDETTGELQDMLEYLGAFVTENEPSVQAYLAQVRDRHAKGQLAGYYAADAAGDSVRSQVRALYTALKLDTKLGYAASVVTKRPEGEYQRVRLPSECLKVGLANCLEGVLLFAGLLEAMGLQAAIVWTPQHAVVAWKESGAAQEWTFLDTVKVGVGEFDAALEWGSLLAEENQASGPDAFRILPIRDLRARGITPLE